MTFAQPNIEDFLALIDWHIGKARNRAGWAVAQVRAQGTVHRRSGRIVLLLCDAILVATVLLSRIRLQERRSLS